MQKPNYARGLAFAGTTALLWAFLPILMKISLKDFSEGSIVWFRFTFAFGVLFLFLKFKKKQPERIILSPPGLGVLAGIFLAGNYYYFLKGIETSSPSNAGILIQTAPVLLVIMGVILFKERFNWRQGIGLAIAVVGFFLFYRDQSRQWGVGVYTEASLYIQVAALLWVGYMVFQKKLSASYEAQQLNLLVYGTAALVLIPAATWSDFNNPHFGSWALLIFLGVNTLLAYGCLTEAVNHIPLWLISVVISLNPFITLVVMHILPMVAPGWVAPEMIGLWGYIGACTAIGGVVMVLRKG
jgi:drug/metabolite transporter (DMT)-like permease